MFAAGCRPKDGIFVLTRSVGYVRHFPPLHFFWIVIGERRNVGIGVDVHVHRITNRLKWHKPPTKNPEETR
jgi:hypothetical protein